MQWFSNCDPREQQRAAVLDAKWLQSCPTLCDPIDVSQPGSPIPGILQARTLEWVAFLLQCMKVKSEHEVAQLCLTLCDPMDFSPPGSSIHGIFQARVLEWVAIAFSSLGWELIRNVHSQNSPQISESQSLCCVGGALQVVWVEPCSCWGWNPAVGSH